MYPCHYFTIHVSVLIIIFNFFVSGTCITWLYSFTKWRCSDVPCHVPCTCCRVIPFTEQPGTGEPWRSWHLCCFYISSRGVHVWNSTHHSYSFYLQCTHVSILAAPCDVRKCRVNKYLDLCHLISPILIFYFWFILN